MSRILEELHIVGYGLLNVAATATQFPNRAARFVCLFAPTGNVGTVYVGTASTVEVSDGTTDQNTGFAVEAGKWTPTLPLKGNLNELYAIAASANDDLIYYLLGHPDI